jgi:MTH538 TIR-like domain (DUF1863)
LRRPAPTQGLTTQTAFIASSPFGTILSAASPGDSDVPEPIAFKYRAFISYSHADTDWARWLHRSLEGFRIDKDLVGRQTATGPIPPALRPVFRDRDNFTAGHTLTEQTQAALDASAALIVICSRPRPRVPTSTKKFVSSNHRTLSGRWFR